MDNQERDSRAVGDRYGDGTHDVDALFRCLADGTRRQILQVLYEEAPDSLTRRDLATQLVPESTDDPSEQETNDRLRRVFDALHHVHLPKLEEAGLVTTDATRETVALTDHPAFADTGVVTAIAAETGAESDCLGALFAALADARRRRILGLLHERPGVTDRAELARELCAVEGDVPESDVSPDAVEQVQATLHHVHLPCLSNADLVEYDADELNVAYEGHPELRTGWIPVDLEA